MPDIFWMRKISRFHHKIKIYSTQKMAYCTLKGQLLRCNMPSFIKQKAIYRNIEKIIQKLGMYQLLIFLYSNKP